MAIAVWSVIRKTLDDMDLGCPVSEHWLDVFRMLQNQHDKEYNMDFYVQAATVLTGLWSLYKDYQNLTEMYLAARRENRQLSHATVGNWTSQIKRDVHERLGSLSFCLPVMESEAKKRETRLVNGKRVHCYTQREKALWPVPVVSSKLCNATSELFQKYWLKTCILDIQENVIRTRPFHMHDYPP